MNKHIFKSRLFLRDIPAMERKEHGLKENPTRAELLTMEQKEHQLKRKPTMSELLKMERAEHERNGKLIVGRGHEGRARK
jgi:hypothetical protein